MTKAVFTVKKGRIISLICQGHSGYAEAGQDIVCAAVSAVLQSAALGIMQVAKVKVQYRTDERTGLLSLNVPDNLAPEVAHDVEVILRTALAGVRDIAAGYSQYVKVEVKDYEVH